LKWIIILVILVILSTITIFYSMTIGEIKLSFSELLSILKNGKGTMSYTILTHIRIPRVILGFAVGGALSLAGVILQGIYRNPLVEPYTLGISGGAALGVALVIVFGVAHTATTYLLPFAGFAGSVITVFMVYFLSIRHGRIRIQSMLLIGVMISFISSSAMMFIMSTSTSEQVHSIVFWIMGSLDEPNITLIKTAAIASIAGLVLTYLFVQPLNALRLGEEKARHLGVNTEWSIRLLFIISSLLVGISVAVAGVIGFVGLVIPHMVRLIISNNYRMLLISSFLIGGIFIVLCDTLARTIISPNELPVGVITGIVGGTVFIVVLAKTSLKK